ncbi:MAG: polysaccharide deacetylase family protein [Patescibacteria group bacterium]|nr:polysaccharide deacetylase family protein [Patescibacteria group bacterium]
MSERLISRRDILKAGILGGLALGLEGFGVAQASTFPSIEPTREAGIIVPGQVIYAADTHRKIVCFTFDDGGTRMRKILDIANKRGIKMTFFPTGNAINADPKLYKDMFEAGHQIGNHTQSHADLTTLTEKGIESQILHAREALWNAVGKEVPQNLLRPPFGAGVRSSKDVDPDLLKAAKKLGYGIAMWNVTSAGTSKYATVDSIKKRVEGSLRNGVIILEHPTLFDTTAFPVILDYALSKGFTPQTISQGLRITA